MLCQMSLRSCVSKRNPDVKFQPLILKHKGVFQIYKVQYSLRIIGDFYTTGSSVVEYYDQRHSTIRHVKCLWRLPDGTSMQAVLQYQNVIRSGFKSIA